MKLRETIILLEDEIQATGTPVTPPVAGTNPSTDQTSIGSDNQLGTNPGTTQPGQQPTAETPQGAGEMYGMGGMGNGPSGGFSSFGGGGMGGGASQQQVPATQDFSHVMKPGSMWREIFQKILGVNLKKYASMKPKEISDLKKVIIQKDIFKGKKKDESK